MKENYEEKYNQIMQGIAPPPYRPPEEQGSIIEKCTILESIEEIEYTSYSKSEKNV